MNAFLNQLSKQNIHSQKSEAFIERVKDCVKLPIYIKLST